MNCPKCNNYLGELKRYDHRNCKCGEQIMSIPDGKKLKPVILGKDKDKGEK